MVQRVQTRLGGIADFLNYGGKLQMVKSVLASLPIFFMCCLDVPVTIKDQVIKYMRHCLWRKKNTDVQAKGNALVSWKKICRPKEQGGLGVLNLDIQNKTLLLKNLDKFFNNLDIPWVNLIRDTYYDEDNPPGIKIEGSFWWKSHLKLFDTYKALARCNLGNGKTALFWTDLWGDSCLHQKFPHLLSFAKKTDISVSKVLQMEFLQDMFHLPLSQQAFAEFEQLEVLCDSTQFNIFQPDSWSYIWGSNKFSTEKAYKVLIGTQHAPKLFTWLWESSCQPKHKFFFWLLLHDRLNTRNLLRRKNCQLQAYNCATLQCSQEETLAHLFWSCSFAQQCWSFICPQFSNQQSIMEALYDVKEKLNLPFAVEIIMIASWSIWIIRNRKIFEGQTPTFQAWKLVFKQEINLLSFRMKKKMG
jgi:hypothetical protein